MEGPEGGRWVEQGSTLGAYQLAVANLPSFIQRSILFMMMANIRGDRLAERLACWRRYTVQDTLSQLHENLCQGRKALQNLHETHEIDVFFDLEAEDLAEVTAMPHQPEPVLSSCRLIFLC